jgi:hypothetical protein
MASSVLALASVEQRHRLAFDSIKERLNDGRHAEGGSIMKTSMQSKLIIVFCHGFLAERLLLQEVIQTLQAEGCRGDGRPIRL